MIRARDGSKRGEGGRASAPGDVDRSAETTKRARSSTVV
jgi:hypothetical protein